MKEYKLLEWFNNGNGFCGVYIPKTDLDKDIAKLLEDKDIKVPKKIENILIQMLSTPPDGDDVELIYYEEKFKNDYEESLQLRLNEMK